MRSTKLRSILVWHSSGLIPAISRRQPDAELQLNPLSSLEQIEEIRSGRLDAGFVFNFPKTDRELDQAQVGSHRLVLAAAKGRKTERP
jgi:DNA-binding transcriptional LysR family regulator